MKFFCCPPMCFFFYPANEQGHSLSLSKKFDSGKELLHPIFSLSKKFYSDKELLVRPLSVSFFIEKEPHKQLRMKRKRKGER
jgi:hypothetical protein